MKDELYKFMNDCLRHCKDTPNWMAMSARLSWYNQAFGACRFYLERIAPKEEYAELEQQWETYYRPAFEDATYGLTVIEE